MYNCAANGDGIYVWLNDLTTMSWSALGWMDAQYDQGGICGPSAGSVPLDVPLTDGHVYQLVAVDPNLIGCGGDDPTALVCRRASEPAVVADSKGGGTTYVIS